MTKTHRKHLPQAPKNPFKRIKFFVDNFLERRAHREGMVPPKSLNFVGNGDFEGVGQEFLRLFVDQCGLAPNHRVLDIGCGIGRMAIPLTTYLSPQGTYVGFDIVKDGINWCNERIASQFANFRFVHSDIYNSSYNEAGTLKAKDYRFPCDDGAIDFAFATSVFTHLLQADTEHYLRELDRCLARGGAALLTFFLLTDDSRQRIRQGKSVFPFEQPVGVCLTSNSKTPEDAIAYPEDYIIDLIRKSGLKIKLPIDYGSWCGRQPALSFQDVLIVTKKASQFFMRALTVAVALVASIAGNLAAAASFSCDKASTKVEKMICADPALSEYDEHLARYYRAGREALSTSGSCLVRNQREWLAAKRNKCADAECLKRVYLDRLAELDPLQPGMTAVKTVDLPKVKALMWILPPVEDSVAAPPPKNSEALIRTGQIINDMVNGDGFVLQTEQGQKHALLMLMFMEEASSDALATLARNANAIYEVHGVRELSSDGTAHFSPGACRAIYRLPE